MTEPKLSPHKNRVGVHLIKHYCFQWFVFWGNLSKAWKKTALFWKLYIMCWHLNRISGRWAKLPLGDATREQKLSPKSWKLRSINKRIVHKLFFRKRIDDPLTRGQTLPIFKAHNTSFFLTCAEKSQQCDELISQRNVSTSEGEQRASFLFDIWLLWLESDRTRWPINHQTAPWRPGPLPPQPISVQCREERWQEGSNSCPGEGMKAPQSR